MSSAEWMSLFDSDELALLSAAAASSLPKAANDFASFVLTSGSLVSDGADRVFAKEWEPLILFPDPAHHCRKNKC
jgi:hypothetical protein